MANPQTSTTKNVVPVQNNCERMIQMRLPGKQTKAGVLPGKLLTLVPGVNLVDADMWTEVQKNRLNQKLLTSKIKPSRAPEQNPERVGQFMLVAQEPISAQAPLSAMNDQKALGLVEEIIDTTLLRKLKGQESRPKILKAIDARIEAIEHPADEGVAPTRRSS